jgi:hypothetical protein
VTTSKTNQNPGPDLAERADYLIEVAARAPSVHSWLRAGQALQRIRLRAASQWVFAGLQTQLMLELGVVRTSHPTGRRPAGELSTDR